MGLGPALDNAFDGLESMMVGPVGMMWSSVVEQLYFGDLTDISMISGGLGGGLLVPDWMPAASFPGQIGGLPRFPYPLELDHGATLRVPRRFQPLTLDCGLRLGSGARRT
jgi:hypothetical protein